MKKKLAITIAITSIAILLFSASACVPPGGLFGILRQLYSFVRPPMEDKNREKADFIEELVTEAIEDESGEKVEEDPEGNETNTAGDGDGANDEQGDTQSDDEEDCDCSDDYYDEEATTITGTDLPEGFPESIPIHSDIQVTRAWKKLVDDKDMYSVSAVSDKSVDEIFNWYKDELIDWEISNEYTNYREDKKVSTLIVKDGVYAITIMVMEDEDEGAIVRYIVKEE